MKHLLIPNRFFASLAETTAGRERAAHSNAEIQQQIDRVQQYLGRSRRRRRQLSNLSQRTPEQDRSLSELEQQIPWKQRRLEQLESQLRPVSTDAAVPLFRVVSIPAERLQHLSGLLAASGVTTDRGDVQLVVQVASEWHSHTKLGGTCWVRLSLPDRLPDSSGFLAEVCPAGTAVTEEWWCQVLPVGWNTELFSVTGAAMEGLLDQFKIPIPSGDTNNLKPLKAAMEKYGLLRQKAQSESRSEENQAAHRQVMRLIRKPWQAVYAGSTVAPVDFDGRELHETLPYFQDLLGEFRYHERFHAILRRSLKTYLPPQEAGTKSDPAALEQLVQSLHAGLAVGLTQTAYRNTHWLASAPKGGQDGPLGHILHTTYRFAARREALREAGHCTSRTSADWDPVPVCQLLLEGAKLAGQAVGLERADALLQDGIERLRDLRWYVLQYSELVRLSAGCLRVLHRSSGELRSVFGETYPHKVQRAVLLQKTVFSFVAGNFSGSGAEEFCGELQSLTKRAFKGEDIEIPDDDLLRQQLCVWLSGHKEQLLPGDLSRQLERAREAYQALPAERRAAAVLDREWRQVCHWNSLLTRNYLQLQQWVTERASVLNDADYWLNEDQRRSVQRRRYCAAVLRLFQQRVIAAVPLSLLGECLQQLAAGADLDQLAWFCAEKGSDMVASQPLGTSLARHLTLSEQREFCQDPCGAAAQQLAAEVAKKRTREGDVWTSEHMRKLLQWVLEARNFGRVVRRSLAYAGAVQDCSDGQSLVERLQLWLQQHEDFPRRMFRHVVGEPHDAGSVDPENSAAEDSEHV
ncbi:MAG: hypothetical protein ACKO3T_25035 [Planctomycetaceae bacterium]